MRDVHGGAQTGDPGKVNSITLGTGHSNFSGWWRQKLTTQCTEGKRGNWDTWKHSAQKSCYKGIKGLITGKGQKVKGKICFSKCERLTHLHRKLGVSKKESLSEASQPSGEVTPGPGGCALHYRRMPNSIPAPNPHWIPVALPSHTRWETTKGPDAAKYPLGAGVGDQISGLETAGLEARPPGWSEASSGGCPNQVLSVCQLHQKAGGSSPERGEKWMFCGEREVLQWLCGEEERRIRPEAVVSIPLGLQSSPFAYLGSPGTIRRSLGFKDAGRIVRETFLTSEGVKSPGKASSLLEEPCSSSLEKTLRGKRWIDLPHPWMLSLNPNSAKSSTVRLLYFLFPKSHSLPPPFDF